MTLDPPQPTTLSKEPPSRPASFQLMPWKSPLDRLARSIIGVGVVTTVCGVLTVGFMMLSSPSTVSSDGEAGPVIALLGGVMFVNIGAAACLVGIAIMAFERKRAHLPSLFAPTRWTAPVMVLVTTVLAVVVTFTALLWVDPIFHLPIVVALLWGDIAVGAVGLALTAMSARRTWIHRSRRITLPTHPSQSEGNSARESSPPGSPSGPA
jgi:hypothetical protein